MPELPEVETVVRTLRPFVEGQRVRQIHLLRQDFASPAGVDWSAMLTGRRVVALARRAKRIVFRLDDGRRFFAHLGMTGRILHGRPGRTPPKHTHVRLLLDSDTPDTGGVELHFVDPRRFGGLVWLGDLPDETTLGPEPLTLRPAELAARLARTRRHVKTALLDQRLIAGIGNIYADEALFLAAIHPRTRCDELAAPAVRRLNRAIKAVLNQAIRHRGSSLRDYVDADGKAGAFQSLHRVYDRAGEPCRRCRTPVQRIILGGRSTHFCPRCQPAQVVVQAI